MTNMPTTAAQPIKLTEGMIIDAYDPGVTTGFCRLMFRGGNKYDLVISQEIPWDRRHHYVAQLMEAMPHIIVVESFRLYSGSAKHLINDTFPSCEMIGAITHAAFRHGIPVLAQQAADIKGKVTVQEQHAEQVGTSPHRQDAYCHARMFILRNRYT
jgi:hypothetical protein